jgi:hypothetical protein
MISIQVGTSNLRPPRVLEVPELLSLICSFSRTADCARLARTCKSVFKVSTAFVWNHVDGAQHLLCLLGGTRTIYHTNKAQGIKKIVRRNRLLALSLVCNGVIGR